jgi:hypothetical protein
VHLGSLTGSYFAVRGLNSVSVAAQQNSSSAGARDIDAFIEGLTDEDRMLIRLREELYEGRWDAMLADLNDRLHGKPYIFRLASRIQDDMARVQRLSRFEREHSISLAVVLWPEEYGQ